jgi:hypothetical protein
MKILRTALAVAFAVALLGPPAIAGGCPCAKGSAVKERGTLAPTPMGLPLPPPLPPTKTIVAAASG